MSGTRLENAAALDRLTPEGSTRRRQLRSLLASRSGAANCALIRHHSPWRRTIMRREASQTVAGTALRQCWRKVRTAQGGVAANGCPPRGEDQSNRDESAASRKTSLPGETGNLYAQQYQIGRRGERVSARPREVWLRTSRRVGSTSRAAMFRPRGMAVTDDASQDARSAQNPAYRLASHFCARPSHLGIHERHA